MFSKPVGRFGPWLPLRPDAAGGVLPQGTGGDGRYTGPCVW